MHRTHPPTLSRTTHRESHHTHASLTSSDTVPHYTQGLTAYTCTEHIRLHCPTLHTGTRIIHIHRTHPPKLSRTTHRDSQQTHATNTSSYTVPHYTQGLTANTCTEHILLHCPALHTGTHAKHKQSSTSGGALRKRQASLGCLHHLYETYKKIWPGSRNNDRDQQFARTVIKDETNTHKC